MLSLWQFLFKFWWPFHYGLYCYTLHTGIWSNCHLSLYLDIAELCSVLGKRSCGSLKVMEVFKARDWEGTLMKTVNWLNVCQMSHFYTSQDKLLLFSVIYCIHNQHMQRYTPTKYKKYEMRNTLLWNKNMYTVVLIIENITKHGIAPNMSW